MNITNIEQKAISEVSANINDGTIHSVETLNECIDRLVSDLGLEVEEISENLVVARNLEDSGIRFDYWIYCQHGRKQIGQTVVVTVYS